MNGYEFQVLFGASNYIVMYPTLVTIPWMWSIVIFNVGMDAFTDENQKAMQGVFLLLMVVVAPTYFATLKFGYTDFIAVSVIQRILPVFFCAAVTGLIGQDAFPNNQFVSLMFLVDVMGGFAHGFAHPNGLTGCFQTCFQLTKKTPTTPYNKALRLESYVGMTYGTMAVIYAAIVGDQMLGMVIGVVATFVVYLWLGFHANDPSETPKTLLTVHRLVIVGALYFLHVQDYAALNDIFITMIASLVAGIVSPYLGAFVSGVSTLYLYKLGCDFVKVTEGLSTVWMTIFGVLTVVSSYGWVYLFYDGYDAKQKKRVMATNWQDRILGFFCFVSGAALDKAGHFAPGTVGEPVLYLLPPVTLWFTLETKMLNHMQVGTPFHPSWWMEGDLPRFSPTDWVNASFGIATALITVILTSYSFYAFYVAIGPENYAFDSESSWKFAMMHGMTFIFHSGMWMIFASSGVPPVGDGKAWRAFPPELKAVVQARPHDCISAHKYDLFIGNMLLFLGMTSVLDDGEYDSLLKAAVGVFWALSAIYKLKVHKDGWGYKIMGDPDPNGTVSGKKKD